MPELFNDEKYFVYGSLIARNLTSRDTLFRLLEIAKNKVVDINLRPPHYDNALLRDCSQKQILLNSTMKN